MSIIRDVEAYESWLRTQCDVVEKGIAKKHKRMAENAFMFFRATCFRFARLLPLILPELSGVPVVPSVGDAHIENWGTWRDGEGRLVWGVNDFDDAADLPFAYDLVRLATSARLAPRVPGTRRKRVESILAGYRSGLDYLRPTFADDERPWLHALVTRPATKSGAFRKLLDKLATTTPPVPAIDALRSALLPGADIHRFAKLQKGGGSLGRPRYLAIGTWRGGPIVREAKALVPSAWDWAADRSPSIHALMRIATGVYRAPDPFLHLETGYIVRRLAPDAAKIDLAEDDAQAFGSHLLSGMGVDLSAIHASEGAGAEILRDLGARDPRWLHRAAKQASAAVERDYEVWRAHYNANRP